MRGALCRLASCVYIPDSSEGVGKPSRHLGGCGQGIGQFVGVRSLEKLYDTHCGQIASHVSCLLAVEDECDVQHSSKIRSAIRHKLVQNELVDFTDIDTKKQAIIHVDGTYDERQFASTSLDLDALTLAQHSVL